MVVLRRVAVMFNSSVVATAAGAVLRTNASPSSSSET